jgi:hypothetical protein
MTEQHQELGYLYDGVYLSYDGWQYWLAVNDSENRVVALEPLTAQLLINALQKHMVRGLPSAIKDDS